MANTISSAIVPPIRPSNASLPHRRRRIEINARRTATAPRYAPKGARRIVNAATKPKNREHAATLPFNCGSGGCVGLYSVSGDMLMTAILPRHLANDNSPTTTTGDVPDYIGLCRFDKPRGACASFAPKGRGDVAIMD